MPIDKACTVRGIIQIYISNFSFTITGGHVIFQNKRYELDVLAKKIEKGEVDEEIIEILNIINSSEEYYTTSSCAGRIQLIALPKLGDKVGSEVLAKWHGPIELDQLKSALKKWDGRNFLMLLIQSPVIHVACRDLESASRLRNASDASGFKYSTIRSIHSSIADEKMQLDIIVEILSTERMDIPIARDGVIFPSDEYMEFMLELARKSLYRSRGKLDRLKRNLGTGSLKSN